MVLFVHAADLHLDSPLRGLDLKEGTGGLVGGASGRSRWFGEGGAELHQEEGDGGAVGR